MIRVADLIELRKLRRAREGIDVAKLNKGDAKRRRKRAREGEQEEEGVKAGLRKGAPVDDDGYVCLSFFTLRDFLLTLEARKKIKRPRPGGSCGRITLRSRPTSWMSTNTCEYNSVTLLALFVNVGWK